jgi:hypothetical protein
MAAKVQRRTVYAITIVSLLALAGSWAFAATVVSQHPPPLNSGVTVVAPNGATEFVQATQLIALNPALETYLTGHPAGEQAGSGNGLNSSGATNVVFSSCGGLNCSQNYSAVDSTNAMNPEDMALQVTIIAPQTAIAAGFDAQVEINYATPGGSPTLYAFGSGYFDTGTSASSATPPTSSISVFLYVDLGTPATNPPTIENVVITLNQCVSATICP